jgi:hypothetical protein
MKMDKLAKSSPWYWRFLPLSVRVKINHKLIQRVFREAGVRRIQLIEEL